MVNILGHVLVTNENPLYREFFFCIVNILGHVLVKNSKVLYK
jgi:hypothetical protein